MVDKLKEAIIEWLDKKTEEDVCFVKKSPTMGIFLPHQLGKYDAENLVREPKEKILHVKQDLANDDRLDILRYWSKKMGTEYIILNPFHPKLAEKYKDKVAIVTFYPAKYQRFKSKHKK